MGTKYGKSWFDRMAIGKDGQKRKFKRLQPIGNSLALFLPKLWVDLACNEDDEGKYWVEVNIDANQVIITGVKELP